MLILAFDTSLSSCSLTISKNREILAEKILFQSLGSSELIIPLLEDQIKKAQILYKDFDLIGISRGPGSYTGVRVGIAVAKGLSLSLKIPIVGISSLQILAYEASINSDNQRNIIAINKARGDELYFQDFNPFAMPIGSPKRINLSNLTNILSKKGFIVTGNLIDYVKNLKEKNNIIFYKNDERKFLPSTIISNILNDLLDNGDIIKNYCSDPIYLNSISQ